MDYPVTSTAGQKIMGYVPRYYETSRLFRALSQARGEELDQVTGALDRILDQFFARTATWGLTDWEKELNLQPEPGFSHQERRDRIVAKLRGYGTCTISLVKQVAEAYEKGAVEVIQDHGLYKIIIKFVDTGGIPPNLDNLRAAVREIVPAHLGVEFAYNYLIWSELDTAEITWNDLDDLQMTWEEFEIWNARGFVRSSLTCTFCEP
jgi:hypothetical protein